VKNGLDFSAFLSHGDEGEEEDDTVEGEEEVRLPELKTLDLLRRRIRTRTLSITSDISQRSAMREETEPPRGAADQMDDMDDGGDDVIDKDDNEKQLKHPTVDKETKGVGSVDLKLYWTYFKSGGNACAVLFLVGMNVLCQALYSGSDIWLTYWTREEEQRLPVPEPEADMDEFGLPSPLLPDSSFVLLPPNSSSANSSSVFHQGGGGDDLLTEHYVNLGIYAAIVVGLMVTSLVRTVHFFVLCMRSSVRLHNAMFWRIIHAPCRFFDTNPVGKKRRPWKGVTAKIPETFSYQRKYLFLINFSILFLSNTSIVMQRILYCFAKISTPPWVFREVCSSVFFKINFFYYLLLRCNLEEHVTYVTMIIM
jgi:hypothetical protein